MFRQLAPTATPLPFSTFARAWPADDRMLTDFEHALQTYLGVAHCVLAASGRTALYGLLRALQITADQPSRNEVVLPAYTCPAVAKVVIDLGLQPRLVDLVPTTLAYDPGQLAATVSEATLAVIQVHPFGLPIDIQPVLALARSANALVIEDAAQSLGAKLAGRPVGTVGDYGLFSLGPGKPLSTGGGGIICAASEAASARLHAGWRPFAPTTAPAALAALVRLGIFTLAFQPTPWWVATRLGVQRVGDHEASWGYTLRGLTPTQAAVGLAQLTHLDRYNQQRRQKAQRLRSVLDNVTGIHDFACSQQRGDEAIYLRFPLLVDDPARRDQLYTQLWAAGIGVGRMYQRTLAEIFPQLNHGPYPGAQQVAQGLLTLPTHHFVTDRDMERIGAIFQAG